MGSTELEVYATGEQDLPFAFAFDTGGRRWIAVPVPFSLIDEPVIDLL